MANNRVTININGKEFETLADLLPESGPLNILFIAKTPALISVEAGHYFQGKLATVSAVKVGAIIPVTIG
jgi:hypothetical protein